MSERPAAVIGSGPNGLAAAVTLARAGVPVTVFEAAETPGGGTRTDELVREGVFHDVCSAIHPMALASPFFQAFELEKRMQFAVPEASYANPLDRRAGHGQDRAAIAYRSLARTVDELGRDGDAYRRFYLPLVARANEIVDSALGGAMLRLPNDLGAAAVLALRALEQGSPLWGLRFREEAASALLTGSAAHSIGPTPRLASAGIGVVLGTLAHVRGWPVPIGGSRAISDALVVDLLAHGGELRTGTAIENFGQLSGYGVKVFDTSARGLARIAGSALPKRYRRKLERFSYGDAATKVDFVLDGPIPWNDPRVAEAPTVHVGGSRAETAYAELQVSRGLHPEAPFVMLAQTERWDQARNPEGVHAIWAYTHVPRGSHVDMRAAVIRQIERFAPGFQDRILSMRQRTAAELAQYNRNYHGGDISAGAVHLRQLLARPTLSPEPWRTPAPGVYLASSSAAPGPGVHGLCGWYAALSALQHEYGLPGPALGLEPS
ncbi:phytoene desaturase family protein [Leucobacter sp. GX24907]